MRLVLVDPPGIEPVDVTEARDRLSIAASVSDDTIGSFIKAARQNIDGPDGWLQRALISQQWRLSLDGGFPCDPIKIPLPPLISVDSVRYVDSTGALQTLDEAMYQTIEGGARALLCPTFGRSWPTTRDQLAAVEIDFTAGYGPDPEDVPEPLRAAILLLVSHLRSMSAQNLFISQETVDGVGSKQYIVGGNAGAAIDAAVQSLIGSYRVYG